MQNVIKLDELLAHEIPKPSHNSSIKDYKSFEDECTSSCNETVLPLAIFRNKNNNKPTTQVRVVSAYDETTKRARNLSFTRITNEHRQQRTPPQGTNDDPLMSLFRHVWPMFSITQNHKILLLDAAATNRDF